MAVEVGQFRVMNDGTVVEVKAVGPERTGPHGHYQVKLLLPPARYGGNFVITRAYGTVATYPLFESIPQEH